MPQNDAREGHLSRDSDESIRLRCAADEGQRNRERAIALVRRL